jgi:hypothetical protein
MSKELIIHLGFPKTATTLLQRGLFAEVPGISYLGKRASSQRLNDASAELVRAIVWSSRAIWERRAGPIVDELLSAADQASIGPGPMILSYEEIMGSCFGSLRVCNRFGNGRQVGVDPAAIVDRIGVFTDQAWPGPVRVLLTVRRQDTFLASLFAQTFLWRHATRLNTFDRFVASLCGTDFYTAGGLALDYDWMAGELVKVMGRERVHLLVYEDIRNDPGRFATDLREVTGIDTAAITERLANADFKVRNVGRQAWRVRRYRGTNRLRHAVQWSRRRVSGAPNPAEIVLRDDQSRAILDVYQDSNRRLGERLSRSLEQYGYLPDNQQPVGPGAS